MYSHHPMSRVTNDSHWNSDWNVELLFAEKGKSILIKPTQVLFRHVALPQRKEFQEETICGLNQFYLVDYEEEKNKSKMLKRTKASQQERKLRIPHKVKERNYTLEIEI